MMEYYWERYKTTLEYKLGQALLRDDLEEFKFLVNDHVCEYNIEYNRCAGEVVNYKYLISKCMSNSPRCIQYISEKIYTASDEVFKGLSGILLYHNKVPHETKERFAEKLIKMNYPYTAIHFIGFRTVMKYVKTLPFLSICIYGRRLNDEHQKELINKCSSEVLNNALRLEYYERNRWPAESIKFIMKAKHFNLKRMTSKFILRYYSSDVLVQLFK